MIYTTKELINSGENEYSIRKKIKEGSLFFLERGVYSNSRDKFYNEEILVCKKYPYAVITGLSAFYLYDLTDQVPDSIYLATPDHGYVIQRESVKQSFQSSVYLMIGVTYRETKDGLIRVYDLERLLIELFRLKEKYPRELFYEVVNSFRKIRDKIDFFKIGLYAKFFSNGDSLLLKIKEMI